MLITSNRPFAPDLRALGNSPWCPARNRQYVATPTGSICLRRPSIVNRWMRAKSRRWHHSISAPAIAPVVPLKSSGVSLGVNRPRSTTPSPSSAWSVASAWLGVIDSRWATLVAVVGPQVSIKPRTIAMRASTDVQSCRTVVGASMEGSSGASGKMVRTAGKRSAGTHAPRPSDNVSRAARLSAASSSKNDCHSLASSTGSRMRLRSRSCSSSASRTSGCDSRTTCSIAPASSRPRSRTASIDMHARSRHGSRAAVLDFAAVQERVRVRVEQFERRTATARACRGRRT